MAVYTHLSDQELFDILSNYPIAQVHRVEGIASGSENTNYLVHTQNEKYILTIFEDRVDEVNLPLILDAMEHLTEANVLSPKILNDSNGKRIQTINDKKAVLQCFLDGTQLREISPVQSYSAGRVLANIHKVLMDKPLAFIPNPLNIDAFKHFLPMIQELDTELEFNATIKKIESALNDIEELDISTLPEGIIHGDYFQDNLLFTETIVTGVIDFWFSCTDTLAYDLAIALNVWGFTNGKFNEDLFDAFYEGYTSIRPLTDEEKKALPTLLQQAAIRFLLTRLYDMLDGKDPEIMADKPHKPWADRLEFHQTHEWNF